MILHPTEIHIQFVEMLQQRAFGHLGKGKVENWLHQNDEAYEEEGR